MAVKVPYTVKLNSAKGKSLSGSQLGSAFSSGAEAYYGRVQELSERVPRGSEPPEVKRTTPSGVGNGKGSPPSRPHGSPQGASAGVTPGRIASSLRAINTRAGKFGNTTKLKPTTEHKLLRKGFKVGAPPEIPLRNGQNKPK